MLKSIDPTEMSMYGNHIYDRELIGSKAAGVMAALLFLLETPFGKKDGSNTHAITISIDSGNKEA